MELDDIILQTYPWWEMQRVRELSFRAKAPEQRLSNVWQHAPGLVDHKYRGVTTPNCDTLYSGAWLDLDEGPILIEVPASALPYWSIAVMDLNTDNIDIMGSRYADSGSLLVCGPGYRGSIPSGIRHVQSASKVVWLLARYLIGSDALLAQAEALRRAVQLTRFKNDGSRSGVTPCPTRSPLISAIRKNAQNFWQIIRMTLDEDSTLSGPVDSPLFKGVKKIWPPGVGDWNDLVPVSQLLFTEAFDRVLTRVTANNSGNMHTRGQWRYPGKDIGRFGENSLYRAEVSLWGLGALPTSEVMYVSAVADAQGEVFQGKNEYKFCIPPEGMPAEEFWSLTMYEVDPHGGMYFTENSLSRYAIGDRTDGLHKNLDRSIDIFISHTRPQELKELANWLPAPAGVFRLMIRTYAPTEALQRGVISPPTIARISV